eukprot:COSAG06_NODE_20361_length_801_cov_1.932761_2_plen_155_part_01
MQQISGLSTSKAQFRAGEGLASDESFLWIDHHLAAAAATTAATTTATTAHGCDKGWATAELNDRQDGRTGAKITRPPSHLRSDCFTIAASDSHLACLSDHRLPSTRTLTTHTTQQQLSMKYDSPDARFRAGEGLASDESFLWIDHHTAAAATTTT